MTPPVRAAPLFPTNWAHLGAMVSLFVLLPIRFAGSGSRAVGVTLLTF